MEFRMQRLMNCFVDSADSSKTCADIPRRLPLRIGIACKKKSCKDKKRGESFFHPVIFRGLTCTYDTAMTKIRKELSKEKNHNHFPSNFCFCPSPRHCETGFSRSWQSRILNIVALPILPASLTILAVPLPHKGYRNLVPKDGFLNIMQTQPVTFNVDAEMARVFLNASQEERNAIEALLR